MVIDSNDYLGATDPSEKDEVAIINTDTADAETDQLVEAPRADDRAFPHMPLHLLAESYTYMLHATVQMSP